MVRAVPLQPNWRVLDYGAGTGLLTPNLQPRVSSLVALEASTGMLAQLALLKPSPTGEMRAYGVFPAVGQKQGE